MSLSTTAESLATDQASRAMRMESSRSAIGMANLPASPQTQSGSTRGVEAVLNRNFRSLAVAAKDVVPVGSGGGRFSAEG